MMLLYACFQLLTDFVEKENLNGIFDWQWTEQQRRAKVEIVELCSCWETRAEVEAVGNLDPILGKWQFEMDNEMLIRLVKVRQYLWT